MIKLTMQLKNLILSGFMFFGLGLLSITSCSREEVPQPQVENPSQKEFTVWQGATFNFTKADEADPSIAANQDRITDNVWITRDNNGGQIYNAKTETSADKNASPKGTEWAIGTSANVANLKFGPFRSIVGQPKDIVGQNLVLHLITDDIYIDIKFTQWSTNKKGGFSYERSSE